jgi:methionine synthase I (cobalamin-dependent)
MRDSGIGSQPLPVDKLNFISMDLDSLLRQSPIITDGAWGTQLQNLGLPGGACPDAWNIERPEVVEQVARAYVSAGSQVILTNTFRANRVALATHGVSYCADAINRAAARISRRAAGGQALVVASMGPCGKLLMAGDVSEAEVRMAFAEQAHALAAGGVDALLIETMADLTEALLALEAAKITGLPVVVSLVFDSGAECDRTMMGVTPEDAARELANAGADVIGANCGQGADRYLAICQRLRAATSLPLWIKPNAGTPEVVDGRCAYPTTPAEFARSTAALVHAGANFVGGCCGTSPDFIRALKNEVQR